MIKVRTFTNELKALHARKELSALDAEVNDFIQQHRVEKVIAVSDTCTSGGGDTIGIIRVMTYEGP